MLGIYHPKRAIHATVEQPFFSYWVAMRTVSALLSTRWPVKQCKLHDDAHINDITCHTRNHRLLLLLK